MRLAYELTAVYNPGRYALSQELQMASATDDT